VPFSGVFLRLIVLPLEGFEVTNPIFDDVANTVERRFYHVEPNDNFHCQTPLKKPKFDLFVSEKCQLANLVGGCE